MCAAAASGSAEHVHLVNAYTVSLADQNPDYREVLLDGGWNFPDGKPLTWASRVRGERPPLRQIRGPRLFLDVIRESESFDLKHYLLGSTPEVLSALKSRIETDFPGAKIVGASSPPFSQPTEEELHQRDREIRSSRADVVWVGLGTPKQDYEAARIAAGLGVVAVAVGAAFEFAAGTKPEAPEFMRRLGFEWAFRLASEPRRLWRRYLFGNLRFLAAVARHWRAKP